MRVLFLTLLVFNFACSSTSKEEIGKMTVPHIEIQRFMGKWYVQAGRFTYFEKEVHNAIEIYTWNESKQRIDIEFTYNKGGFDGPIKSLPQTAWIENASTNAHWKVSPFWPLKFDYLVLAVADDYSWTAIGVPNQKYLWIMTREAKNNAVVSTVLAKLNDLGYNTKDIVSVPHK